MRTLAKSLILLAASGAACFAQKWEFGFNGGASVVRGLPVTAGSSSATAGFKTSGAFGVSVGQNLYKYVGGEVRYEYIMGDLRVKSGGTEATFGGASHAVHYDVLLHTANQDSRRQFFVAIGGGMKVFQGTGRPAAFQPLSQFIYMTETRVVKPMASLGSFGSSCSTKTWRNPACSE
jgi:hypothetical protein